MTKKCLVGVCLTAVMLATLALPVVADPQDRLHLHVGGGLAHRPHAFTMQVWYRDIVYDESAGDTRFTSLDVYTPDPSVTNAPVMVFVHGGGFRVGDKASSKDLDPKPEYFCSKLGYVFVSINYRLLPEGKYPRNVQDVANALAWVQDNIGEFGGNPQQIFLMGHSAGASLVAQVATDETFLKEAGKDLGLLKGVIANDGGYGVAAGEDEASRNQELYGDNWHEVLPIANVKKDKGIPPFLLMHVVGGNTLVPGSDIQAIGLANVLREAGVRAELLPLDHVEHFGANEQIGEPGDITTVSIEHFLDSITGRKTPAEWTSFRPPAPPEK